MRVALEAQRRDLDAQQLDAKIEMTLAEAMEQYVAEKTHSRHLRGFQTKARKVVAGPGYEGRFGLDPRRETKYEPTWERRALRTRRAQQDQLDFVIALLDTGARYSEMAELTWDMVDTAKWTRLYIYRQKVENEGVHALTKRLRGVLQRRREDISGSSYVFPSLDPVSGRYLDKPRGHSINGILKAMDRAGVNTPVKIKTLGRATVHTLRDTYASRLVQRGMSLFKVQKQLGHTSPVMTQKYAHLAQEDVAIEAAELLDGGLGNTLEMARVDHRG